MPVVSPSRFTTSTSSGLTSGSYRTSLGTSSSLDRPYYRTTSSYVTPSITRSNYGDRSSTSEYRSSRMSVTSDSGLDGRRERKSSFTSEYSRSFSRAPSVGDSDSGLSTSSRYVPRSERSESRSRDISATRSDSTKLSNSDPLPRNSTGTLSRTRNPSTSSILSCSATDFYNKYSPANYVPLTQRLNAVASANNSNSNTNGTAEILRSNSISNDIGRPPAPFDSRSSRKNRTTVTNNEKKRAVETIGKHIRSASSSSGVSPSKYKDVTSSTYPQVNPKKNLTGRDRNGNDLHQSVAEIRKRFDPKMTVTKLPANDTSYVTNYVNQLKNVDNGSLNGSRTVQRDEKLVPVHLPSLSNGSHKWDTLSSRSDSNSDLSSRTNSDGTVKGRESYDVSSIYVSGKSTERVPLKYQLDRNSPIAKILEKSTVIHVDSNDTGFTSSPGTKNRLNVISIEVGSGSESQKSTRPSHSSNFASLIQISTPIATGTSSATVIHSKSSRKTDLDVQEIPRYSPHKTEMFVQNEKTPECNLSKISFIDQDTEIGNKQMVDTEIESPDYPNAGFENRTFEHENYLSKRNTVDEVDCTVPKFNETVPYEKHNGFTNGDDKEKSPEKIIPSTSSSEMNDDSSPDIPTVRRKVPDLLIPIGADAETAHDLPPTSSSKRTSLGVAGGNSSAVSSRRNSDQPTVTNGHTSSKASGLNGLRNIGNTCFMNSVIQCLSNTRPLLEFVTEDKYVADINTSLSPMKGALIQAFATVIKELWQEGEHDMVVNTTALKTQIQRFAPRFIGYSQQDAQEFLRYLLEGLHEDVNRVTVKPKPIHTEIDDHLSDSEKASESWRRYQRMEDSRVSDIFVGQLKSQLKCTHCSHTSVTFDPFWDLSLPIPSRTGQLKLQQCLAHFTKEEEMDGDEKPTCAKCGVRRKCLKWFTVQKFPQVLVVHLKRFSPTERFRGKLSVVVDFPLTGLDMSPYAANKGQQTTYNLCAVSNHSGTTYSGHYTAYCKHPYNQEWHEYNDTRVTPISPKNVVSSEAYVLFYELANSSNDRASSHL